MPSKLTGFWVFVTPIGAFDGPAKAVDADGREMTVTGTLGFVDRLVNGRAESRLAILAKITGTNNGRFCVRFRDGQVGEFAQESPYQLDVTKSPTAA